MKQSIYENSAVFNLEKKLSLTTDPSVRFDICDKLIAIYTFTNIREAQKMLDELAVCLEKYPNKEYLLRYYMHSAVVENLFYNYQVSETYFRKALDLVADIGNVSQQTEILIDYTGTLLNLNEQEKAQIFIEKAHRNLLSFPDDTLAARLACREGYLWLHYTDLEQAVAFWFKSEKLFLEIDNKDLTIKDLYFQTLIHTGLGNIYERTGDYRKSVAAYLKVVEMSEKNAMRSRIAWHYLNVGNAYLAMHDFDNAETFFRRVNQTTDDLSQTARAYATANIGNILHTAGKYAEALEHYDFAEDFYQKKGDELINLSRVYLWKAQIFDAYGKPKKAIQHFAFALESARMTRDFKLQAMICSEIAQFYYDRADYRNAADYRELHTKFLEKHFEQVLRSRADEIELKMEAERRKQEAEKLKLYATSLQLKALRAQMNPHFMFNALNSIQHLITAHDSEKAGKYLARFAKLMRASLEYSEMEVISLEDEIKFIEDYLIINQKLRFDDKLTYAIEIDEDLEDDIIGVPTMLVQPYIENAIEHGLRPKRGGNITIKFRLNDDEDAILCSIEDNGIGRVAALRFQASDGYQQTHKSRGTAITEQRLLLLNAEKRSKFSVKITDLYDPLSNNDACGTRIEIMIPIMEL